MNKKIFGLAFIHAIFFGLLTFQMTNAYFTDSASSQNNTFTVDPVTMPVGTVVINEIMWMGSTAHGSADQWVELKNTSGNSINISGWIVRNLGSNTTPDIMLPHNSVIPANGFYLISNNTAASSIINVTPDFQTASVSLLIGGEQLTLFNNDLNAIDVANGTSGWRAGLNSTFMESMERNTPPGDGTVGSSWHSSSGQVNLDSGVVDFATPKADNSPGS